MVSQARQQCTDSVTHFAEIINAQQSEGQLLYVGIAGDPPGGEYTPLFPKYTVETFDADPAWGPDIVGDITGCDLPSKAYDIILCVQVIEHVPNLWDIPKEVERLIKPGGWLIIDCPWEYPYHAEPPSFGDYWRVSKDGFSELFKNTDFEVVEIQQKNHNTSCLFRRKV